MASDTTNASDERLVELLGKGDSAAFSALYDRYFGRLAGYVLGFVNDPQQAEDLVQDVFLKLIKSPGAFDPGKRFSTWVYTVAGNAARNHLRNKTNRARLLTAHLKDQPTRAPAHPGFDQRRLQERLRILFAQLSEKEKTVYLLRFEHDLSIKEIAAIAGIPEGSVKSCIYYLLKKFGNSLKEFQE